MRFLGLDYGDKRVGVAVSDPDGRFSIPVETLARTPDLAQKVAELVARYDCGAVVLGLPRHLRGEQTPQTDKVKAFGEELTTTLSCEIIYWDERLTTVSASRSLQALGLTSRQQKGRLDPVAANVMLQAYLDFRKNQRHSKE
jgi:putative Holliday junction resolvase